MTGNEQRASQSGAGVVAIFTAQRRDHIRGFDDTGNPIDPATFGGTNAERLLMLFAVCEARSADGKPLRGSVMNIVHDGIHKFPQQIVRIPAAPISPHAKPETKPPTQTKDSQFQAS